MKKLMLSLLAVTALTMTTRADDKAVTLTGEGMCAKCELSETKKCQNAVKVTKDGKSTVYYLEDNQLSKDFHKNLCSSTAKITVTGTVAEKDGKRVLTATKIDLVK